MDENEEVVCAAITVETRYLLVGSQHTEEVIGIKIHLPHGETKELWMDATDMDALVAYWVKRRITADD